jgi:hypothetical protein
VTSEPGWFARFTDRLFRDTPLAQRETIALATMNRSGRVAHPRRTPERVRFSFPADLDDPSLVFLAWGPGGFERVEPPPLDASVTVSAAPLFVTDVLRPHLRRRATESGQLFTDP